MNPREELNRVLTGELAFIGLLRLSKETGYHLDRLKDMAREMGLHVSTADARGRYRASLPLEGETRYGRQRTA